MGTAELVALKEGALQAEASVWPLVAAGTGWGVVLALCLAAPAPTWQQVTARQSVAARQGVESASMAHARELYRQRALVAQRGRREGMQLSAVD